MTSKCGKKKNITNANNKSVISLREMLEKDVGLRERSKKQPLSKTKKQTTSREKSTLTEKFEYIDVDKCDIPQNLPIPNIQIHNKIDNLVVNETLPLIANNEKRRQQRSVNLKQLPTSLNVPIQNDSIPSTSGLSTKAISSQHTEKTTIESSIKRKKFDEFNDLPTKHKY